MLTKEQLQIRKLGLGGSEIAAICGYSTFKSPLDIYLDKINDEINQIENDAIWWGNELEDLIIKFYERKTGKVVEQDNNTYFHPRHSWMLANIDGWIDNRSYILECKSTHGFNKIQWGEEGTDQFPMHYICQCAWYCAILDKPKADLAVFAGTQAFRIYTYYRDLDFENMLIKVGQRFWHENVLKRIPPEPVFDYDILNLYPKENNQAIVVDDVIMQKYNELVEIKKSIKIMDDEKKNLELAIKDYIGDNSELHDYSGNTIITFKNTKPRLSFDIKKFRIDQPILAKEYSIEGDPTRVFLIKGNNDE